VIDLKKFTVKTLNKSMEIDLLHSYANWKIWTLVRASSQILTRNETKKTDLSARIFDTI